MADTFKVNRGSGVAFAFNWPVGDGQGGVAHADLTGFAVGLDDMHPALAGLASVALVDAGEGRITGTVAWADALPDGRVVHFRVRIVPVGGGVPQTTNRLWIEYI